MALPRMCTPFISFVTLYVSQHHRMRGTAQRSRIQKINTAVIYLRVIPLLKGISNLSCDLIHVNHPSKHSKCQKQSVILLIELTRPGLHFRLADLLNEEFRVSVWFPGR